MKKSSIFLTVIMFSAAACAPPSSVSVNNAANTTGEAAANNNATPGAKAKADIINSVRKMAALDAWAITNASDTLPDMNIKIEYNAPDKFHLRTADTDAIIVGSDAYAKDGKGWKKFDGDLSEQVNAMKNLISEATVKGMLDPKIIGKETLGKRQTTVYSYKIYDPAIMLTVNARVWIADDTGLTLKNVVETEGSDKPYKMTTGYEYDKVMKIEKPEIK